MPWYRISAGYTEEHGSTDMIVEAESVEAACIEAIRRIDDGEETTKMLDDSAGPTVVWLCDQYPDTDDGDMTGCEVPVRYAERDDDALIEELLTALRLVDLRLNQVQPGHGTRANDLVTYLRPPVRAAIAKAEARS